MTIPQAPLGTYSADPDLLSVAGARLAAGTYRDREFRDHVLRDFYNAYRRRTAPSHGFDLVPVIRHAWAAWWLETGRHLAVLAVLGCWLTVRPLDTLAAIDLLVTWELLRRWLSWVLEDLGYGSRRDRTRGRPEEVRERNLVLRGKLLKRSLAAASAVLASLLLVSASAANRRTRAPAASWATSTLLTITAVIVTLIAVISVTSAVHSWRLARLRTPAGCRRRGLSRRMRAIEQQQRHPFTVHSRFKPFLGSGRKLRGWSFAQRLVPANRGGTGPVPEFNPPPFTTSNLVRRLREVIEDLRQDTNPETRLPDLCVSDCVFVEGARSASVASALVGDPDSDEVKRAIEDVIAKPSGAARHYLSARIVSWAGEVVTTVFVHVSLQGRTLYIEFATYALYPIRPEYGIDSVGDGRAGRILGAVAGAVASLPTRLIEIRRLAGAPAVLLPALRASRARHPDPGLGLGPYGDIGAESSVRESAMIGPPTEYADKSVSGYFQSQDIAQHSKIIERRLIAALDDYLIKFGVDSSEFVQRTTAILNNGILNTGSGTINAENTAVGDNSTVFA
jgi:hypothetical protein